MKVKLYQIVLLLAIVLSASACKNEFERLRASSDTALVMRKALDYYDKKDYVKAQALFEIVMPNIRGGKDAENVYFKYAYTHYYLEKLVTANYYFKNFASTYPNSPYREEADFMAAYSHYEMSPGFRLDQTFTDKAIDGFQIFVNTYPESIRVKECNQLINDLRKKEERKAFSEALLYFDLREYQSAIQVYENLLKDYPETKSAEEIRYMIVKSTYLLAENSIFEKRDERYNKVISRSQEFKDKYEKSKWRKEVDGFEKSSGKRIKELKKQLAEFKQ